MPRGTQFGQLIDMFRDEAGHANSRALGQNELDRIKAMLRRTYRRLHTDFPWPHLRVFREKNLLAGEQYYSFPPDLDSASVTDAWVRDAGGDTWCDLNYGIGIGNYNSVASGQGERHDYPSYWNLYEDDQFEVWPIPKTDGYILRFYGTKRPEPLVEESETVDLDDDLIVLYAVAETLARERSSDTELKLGQARAHYMRLRGNSQQNDAISMKVSADRRAPWGGVNIDFAERR